MNKNYGDYNSSESSFNKYYVYVSLNKYSGDISFNINDKAGLLILDPDLTIIYFEKYTGRKKAEEKLKNLKSLSLQKINSIIDRHNPDKLNLYFALLES